jgi:acyl-CoA synthetase (AMP-forming)/AMP-acid ligase II
MTWGMRTNLHHLIEDGARAHSDSPALPFKQETLNYDALWTQVRGIAAGLAELGVRREQRIAVFLHKRIETVAAIFEASAVGAAFVPMNPLLRPAQSATSCGTATLVCASLLPSGWPLMRDELASCPTIEDVVLVGARIEEEKPRAHYRVPFDRAQLGEELARWSCAP